jgi:F-type H+-transporting ATPase subunit delta
MVNNKQAKREAKQLFRLCRVNSLVDEDRVRQVVKQVMISGRRDSHAILAQFLRLVRLDQYQHTVKVESAMPLSAELQQVTQASLIRLYGPGLATSFADRPSLIGGMRIQVGSDVYDVTVQSELAALERRF